MLAKTLVCSSLVVLLALVEPSFGWDFKGGYVCRYVNTTTQATINETGCPFSDMDPPPYICQNSSSAQNGRRFKRDDRGRFNFDWGNWGRRQPVVRKDYCVPANAPTGQCTTDADCPNVPGLLTSTCISRSLGFGRTYSFCMTRPSSVNQAMAAAQPCEIRNGRVLYRDLTGCENRRADFGGFGGGNGDSGPQLTCEDSPSLTVRVNTFTYRVKVCVPDNNANNGVNP